MVKVWRVFSIENLKFFCIILLEDIMYELSVLDVTTTLSLVLQHVHSNEVRSYLIIVY